MKIGKCFILCFILIFGTLSYGLDSVSITADPGSNVLNEWKSPGRYSPINAFDGDLKTCYAEGWREMNTGDFEIKFDRCITIDELRFAAGYFKSKSLFEKNNRVKKISLYFKVKDADKVEKVHFIFKDKMEIQSKDIKSVTIDSILFGIDDVYKGSQYDDTCISEIQLVNKGEIIQIKNRDNMQQQYITHLQSKLKKLFQDMKYEFNLCNDGSVFFSSDATIKHKLYGPCDKALPERWKVKGARLFFYYKGKWQLVKYYTDISFESFFIDKIGNTNFNYSVEYSPVQ